MSANPIVGQDLWTGRIAIKARIGSGRNPPCRPVLGVDVGRVITGEDPNTGLSLLSSEWQEAPEVHGAIDHLAAINSGRGFSERVYLVSKAGPTVEARTRAWLAARDFYRRTGIDASRLYFVRERSDKAEVCERLGVTHFIDDRISVLLQLASVQHRLLFLPETPPQVPPGIVHVRSWPELQRLLATLADR